MLASISQDKKKMLFECLPVESIFVSHTEFSLVQNSNTESPNCVGIDGVLEAYFQSLRTVQLYGPTNFAPVINQVARWETHRCIESQMSLIHTHKSENVCFCMHVMVVKMKPVRLQHMLCLSLPEKFRIYRCPLVFSFKQTRPLSTFFMKNRKISRSKGGSWQHN